MAVVPAAALLPAFSHGAKASPPSLNAAAALNGRYFGAAVRTEYMEGDPKLREEIVQHCGWITPEIHLKWNSIENRRGRFWFEPVDKLVRFAATNGMQVHGHTLLWDKSTPDWVKREMRRHRDWRFVENHFRRLMTRYASIRQWDVVNGLIDTQAGDRQGLRRNTFYRAYGPDYIALALDTARRHAPDAKLMLNDYSFEYENYVDADRRTAFLKLIERLRKAAVPLDGARNPGPSRSEQGHAEEGDHRSVPARTRQFRFGHCGFGTRREGARLPRLAAGTRPARGRRGGALSRHRARRAGGEGRRHLGASPGPSRPISAACGTTPATTRSMPPRCWPTCMNS